jgi:hypothetical protein
MRSSDYKPNVCFSEAVRLLKKKYWKKKGKKITNNVDEVVDSISRVRGDFHHTREACARKGKRKKRKKVVDSFSCVRCHFHHTREARGRGRQKQKEKVKRKREFCAAVVHVRALFLVWVCVLVCV